MTTIFISIPWFLPAYRAGGPVQSIANMINQFDTDISYKIFCGNVDLNGEGIGNIETGKWVTYNEHTKVWYADPLNRTATLQRLVKESKPDVLFIVGIYSWVFNIIPILTCRVPRKIISVRGMLHPGALSQKRVKKNIFLFLFKLLNIQHKVIFHATDENEKRYIKKHMGNEAVVYIAGNFPRILLPLPGPEKNVNHLSLISIALISPMKNYLLVLQSLRRCTAKIEYHICGPVKDSNYWKLCEQEIKLLPENIRVVYHGEVEPQKLPGFLAKGHVFILPSKSVNFGHAIYEAFTAEKPVITSLFTPWNQLASNHAGMNVELDVQSITSAIQFFAAMSQSDYNAWRKAAREYALNALDVEVIKREYSYLFFDK